MRLIHNDRARRLDRQRGAGLVLVLVIGAALLAMGALAEVLFKSAATGSTRHVKGEQAIHLAEQGVDQAIGRLQESSALSYNTDTNYGFPTPASTVVTPDQEQAWLLANFGPAANTSGYAASWLQKGPDGEFVSVRPSTRKTIYGISWVPSRAKPKRVRVLKAEWLPANFSPIHAILVGGSLELAGNAAVSGIAGSVHANGDIATTGNSVSVSKTVSTSGVFQPDPPNFQSVGGTENNSPRQTIPVIDPDRYWTDHHNDPAFSGAWLDFCGADESVRLPSGSSPCTGTVVGSVAGSGTYQGWDYKASTSTWSYNGAGDYFGVFFFYRATVTVSGSPGTATSPWRATIIASSAPIAVACGHQYGDIKITGSPKMTSFGENNSLTMMAGTDLTISGTTQTSLSGLFAAHEQLLVDGNGTLDGSLVAQDHCHTAGTPVDASKVSGSMSITFNKDVTASLGTTVRTTLWQELSSAGFGGS